MQGVLVEITPTGRTHLEVVRFDGCPDRYGRYEVMGNCYEADKLIRQFEREMKERYMRVLPKFDFLPDKKPSIKKVIFNDPATIVIWDDNTKTVVKCQPGDVYSKELGLAMCISKKFLGNKGNFNEELKKWIPGYELSIDEMRDKLDEFCNGNISCVGCILNSYRCGSGVSFKTKNDSGYYVMTNDEIKKAYKKVFK